MQSSLVWEDPAANLAHFTDLLRGEEGKHDLVILPEMFTTGFTMSNLSVAESPEGPALSWMLETAQRLDALVMGSVMFRLGDAYYNRMLAVAPGMLLAEYDKRHLFSMAGEDKHFQAGQVRMAFEWKGWRIAPQICYDLRFPSWARNAVDAAGRHSYDLLVYVANWPEARAAHWKTLLQARAIENQAFVAGVNRVGTDGAGFSYTGDSLLVDPMGHVLLSAHKQPQLLTAEIHASEMEDWRSRFPLWKDADPQQFPWQV